MKTFIFSILSVLSTLSSYGQLTMRIDSVDISYSDKIPISYSETHVIVATIINRTNNVVRIYNPGIAGYANIGFAYRGKEYSKPSPWTCPIEWEPADDKYLDSDQMLDDFGYIIVRPNSSKVFIFQTYIPDPQNRYKDLRYSPQERQVYSIYPEWSWGKENPSDADYLQWFKNILPSLQAGISCQISTKGRLYLLSIPIDLKKVIVTSNMTKERLN